MLEKTKGKDQGVLSEIIILSLLLVIVNFVFAGRDIRIP